MGKIVIWNSEICSGHTLHCKLAVPALLGPTGSRRRVKLSWERQKANGAKGTEWGGGCTFCPHLGDQRANLTTVSLFRRHWWSRWSVWEAEGPAVDIRLGQLPGRRSAVWSAQMEGRWNRYPASSVLSQKWVVRILALPLARGGSWCNRSLSGFGILMCKMRAMTQVVDWCERKKKSSCDKWLKMSRTKQPYPNHSLSWPCPVPSSALTL